jgi:hypothetical protein
LNHTTTISIIRIIIAIALATSLVVAGVSLDSLLKQHQGYAAPPTKKQEQSTIQNLHGNFAREALRQTNNI